MRLGNLKSYPNKERSEPADNIPASHSRQDSFSGLGLFGREGKARFWGRGGTKLGPPRQPAGPAVPPYLDLRPEADIGPADFSRATRRRG